jgi:hypothetical protein
MGALVVIKTSIAGKDKIEIDLKELKIRLKSIANGCNIEVMQLAISTMLEELNDAARINKVK